MKDNHDPHEFFALVMTALLLSALALASIAKGLPADPSPGLASTLKARG